MTDHVSSLQKTKNNDIMLKSTVNDVARMTDRMIQLKQGFNNTYDVLINKMIEQSLKIRQVEVLENGKVDDNSDYDENVETVFTKLKAVKRLVKASSIKTKEVLHFTSLREARKSFLY